MDMLKQYQWLFEYSSTLKESTYHYKDEWEVYRFMLFDKMYGMIGFNNDNKLILTLKGLPEENTFLIKNSSSVMPGYYMNKNHWFSIDLLIEEFNKEELQNFLKQSYELIKKQLPKKIQNKM